MQLLAVSAAEPLFAARALEFGRGVAEHARLLRAAVSYRGSGSGRGRGRGTISSLCVLDGSNVVAIPLPRRCVCRPLPLPLLLPRPCASQLPLQATHIFLCGRGKLLHFFCQAAKLLHVIIVVIAIAIAIAGCRVCRGVCRAGVRVHGSWLS